jgi:hypothetical protein
MLGKTEKPILDNKYFIEKINEKLPIDKESITGVISLLTLELYEMLATGKTIKLSNCIELKITDVPGQKVMNKKEQLILASGHKELSVKITKEMRRTYHKLLDYEKIDEI